MYQISKIATAMIESGFSSKSQSYLYRSLKNALNGNVSALSDAEITGLEVLLNSEFIKIMKIINTLKQNSNETRSTATKHNG